MVRDKLYDKLLPKSAGKRKKVAPQRVATQCVADCIEAISFGFEIAINPANSLLLIKKMVDVIFWLIKKMVDVIFWL